MTGETTRRAPGTARLVLMEVAPEARIDVPERMRVGDAIAVPPAAAGRWITIGSGADQDIVLRDEPRGIHRSHCRMILRGGAYQLQGRLRPDGYRINGELFVDCTSRPLREGDMIQLGKHVTLRFTREE